MDRVLFFGHGFPRFYQNNMGPSILYYSFLHGELLETSLIQSELDISNTYAALISVEEYTLQNRFNPRTHFTSIVDSFYIIPPSDIEFCEIADMQVLESSLKVCVPKSTSLLIANATFTLELLPTVRICFASAQRIKHTVEISIPSVEVPWNQIDTFESQYWVWSILAINLDRMILTMIIQ
jgi:hypothetical protein